MSKASAFKWFVFSTFSGGNLDTHTYLLMKRICIFILIQPDSKFCVVTKLAKFAEFYTLFLGYTITDDKPHNGTSITRRKLVREAQRAAHSAGRPYMLLLCDTQRGK